MKLHNITKSLFIPIFLINILVSICNGYFEQSYFKLDNLNQIDLTEEDDVAEGRVFFGNITTLGALAALSLFPLLFLAAAVGGALLQWWLSYHVSYDKCDDHYYDSHYYDSGYGGGGGYGGGYSSGGYGGGHRRSDDDEGYDHDYKRSFKRRSAISEKEFSGMFINPINMTEFSKTLWYRRFSDTFYPRIFLNFMGD